VHGREAALRRLLYILTDRLAVDRGWPDNGPLFFYYAQAVFLFFRLGKEQKPRLANTPRHTRYLYSMTYTERERLIRNHLDPLARDMGLEIWGVELGGGSRQLLRIFVETPPNAASSDQEGSEASPDVNPAAGQGVGIEQCAELSRRLGLALEVDDVFPEAWTLEVSSPGFERPFFHPGQLPPYVGREIEAVLAAPLDSWPGRKKFRGILTRVEGDTFTIALDADQRRADEPETADLPWDHVRKANLVYVYVEPEKPGKAKKVGNSKGADGPLEAKKPTKAKKAVKKREPEDD